jgi:GDP-L-fucose synthase
VYLLQNYDAEPILNVGWGEDVTINELAEMVMSAIGYTGRLTFDASKPDRTPRKLRDVSRLHSLGWRLQIPLKKGIETTYCWFKEHAAPARLSRFLASTVPNSAR